MKSSTAPKRSSIIVRHFDSHESARAQSLEGVLLAAFWQRAAAFMIDLFLTLAIHIPTIMLYQYLQAQVAHRPLHIAMRFRLRDLQDLAWLIAYAGLSVCGATCLTLGKRLLRIRVVSLKREKIMLWQALERALGYGASALEGGFGFFQYFIHHNCQCVHDRIAETIVVSEPKN